MIAGHALLENLATAPSKTSTAHGLLVDPLGLDAARLGRQALRAAAGAGRAGLVAGQRSARFLR